MVSGNILASAHGVVGYLQPRGAFRHLRSSPTSSTCLLHQFPFEYVTLKDKQAYNQRLQFEEGVFVTVTGLRDVYNKGLFFVSYLSNYVYRYLKRTIGPRLVSVF